MYPVGDELFMVKEFPFHEAYKLIDNGEIHYLVYNLDCRMLYIYDDSSPCKCLAKTKCEIGDYRRILKHVPLTYKFSDTLPF